MREEKDMIEINLNTPPASAGKETNYFGNIRFARTNRDFPYGLHRDEHEDAGGAQKAAQWMVNMACKEIGKAAGSSCLRQMYCPDCQQRLQEETDTERYGSLTCCLPLFPFASIYRCCKRRPRSGKVICKECGSYLGLWKYS